jgi:coiled-coil domain-containing protein 39
VKAAEEHLHAAKRQNNVLKAGKVHIDNAIATLQLETESIARQLRTAVEGKEKALVDHDLLKLEVHPAGCCDG